MALTVARLLLRDGFLLFAVGSAPSSVLGPGPRPHAEAAGPFLGPVPGVSGVKCGVCSINICGYGLVRAVWHVKPY